MLRSLAAFAMFTLTVSLHRATAAQNPPSVAQQQAQAHPAATPTLRTAAKMVIVDVTVTDRNHHAIHGLKPADFAVLENNVSQPVKSFEEHTAPTAEQLTKISAMPSLPPNVFTNYTPAPAAVTNGPVNVLLIDRMNTPMTSQNYLRNEVIDYLKKSKPGQRIAIFVITQQLSMVLGFTDDHKVLLNAMQRLSGRGSPLAGAAVSPEDNTNPKPGDPISDALVSPGATLLNSEIIPSFREMDRAQRTLQSMNDLARYLVDIPGRKNVIWFSGSFPLEELPNPDAINGGFEGVDDRRAEYRETISLLSRAQVAVYPVLTTGTWVSNCFSVAKGGPMCAPQQFSSEQNDHFAEETTAKSVAHETGGRPFLFNDLSGAVAEAIDDGSSYYTLTYSPTDTNWHGDFRKIEVRLRQQGYNLSYRRGYYADDPNSPPTSMEKVSSGRAVTAPLGPPPDFSPMHMAMLHGGPAPTEIVFTAKVTHQGTAETLPEDNAIPGGLPSGDSKGPYRLYRVDYATYLHAKEFRDAASEKHHAALQFLIFVYDRDGRVVNIADKTVNLDLTGQSYTQALKDGITFHQEIGVPAKAPYSLRIALHDLQADGVGAIEVPISAVKELTAK